MISRRSSVNELIELILLPAVDTVYFEASICSALLGYIYANTTKEMSAHSIVQYGDN